jgi:hypothetical protein
MPSIERYYDDVASITEWNNRMLTLDDNHRPKGAKQLLNGRVVVLRDGVSLWTPYSLLGLLIVDSCSISNATSL